MTLITCVLPQVDEYSEAIGKSLSTGIRLLVHDQLDPPLADTHGMTIGPGVAASIGIRKQKVIPHLEGSNQTKA